MSGEGWYYVKLFILTPLALALAYKVAVFSFTGEWPTASYGPAECGSGYSKWDC